MLTIDGPTAQIEGNVKYNASDSVSYLKKETNSGALINDGSVYAYSSGGTLKTIKQNEAGKVYDYKEEAVDSSFKYETSMYAKALFEFSEADINDVTEAQATGTYNISYSKSASGKLVSGVFSLLESPVLKAFVNVPDISDSVTCTVSFSAGNIAKYNYSFTAVVAGQSASVSYELTMKSMNKELSIASPNFDGLATTGTALSAKIADVATAINNYRSLQTSGYNYDVKTAVDYPGSNAINSRSQGRTMRKVENGNVYFWNRLEFDSDYKNGDLYKKEGIKDYVRYRARILNGDIYDVTDGVLSNTRTKLDCTQAQQRIDEFYFLPGSDFFNTNNISIVQYGATATEKTYSFGLKQAGVQTILDMINAGTRVDVNLEKVVSVFNVANGSLAVREVQFDVVLDDKDSLKSIKAVIKGSASGAYAGTEFSGTYNFKLNYEITVNNKADDYEIPETEKKIVLPNS